jgi:hypothetical protein
VLRIENCGESHKMVKELKCPSANAIFGVSIAGPRGPYCSFMENGRIYMMVTLGRGNESVSCFLY